MGNMHLPAADKLHDFEGVVRAHLRLVPARARQNIAIVLDRDAVLGHPEVFEQRSHIQAVGNFPALSIDCNRHESEP